VSLTGNNPYADGSTNPANGFVRWLDPTAFIAPTLGTFGNMARNSVRGPYNKNVDLALTRSFPIGNQAIEVRAEAFNAFNWLELMPPPLGNLSITSGTFGQINSAFPPRIIQLAVKYTF
jgi:hypothetical protein